MSRSFRCAGFAAALLLACGCATPSTPPPVSPPAVVEAGDEPLWTIYAAAIETAKYPAAEHVSRDLTPLVRFNPDLQWDDQGRVLMVTWTKRKYYAGKQGQPYELPDNVTVWLTAVPYLQRACQSWDLPANRLPLRIAQALGMPPPQPGDNDAFVQMWAEPRTFFRPCPDPEITDRECQVSLDTGPVNRDGSCPWTFNQVSAAFVEVSKKHLAWMCENWKNTYTGDPKTSYPWTALGYTFDWGDLLLPVGQSEYVAPPGTTVWIDKIFSADEYCRSAD